MISLPAKSVTASRSLGLEARLVAGWLLGSNSGELPRSPFGGQHTSFGATEPRSVSYANGLFNLIDKVVTAK